MHPPTNKKHNIKYQAQPPRKRRGFFHTGYFHGPTLFYLTKVNKSARNTVNTSILQLRIINSRLGCFVHFTGNYLTISRENCLFCHPLTYYRFNPFTIYPFKPLTLSCKPNIIKQYKCH